MRHVVFKPGDCVGQGLIGELITMPSYAKIMSDALKENKFDPSFSDGMMDRIESMNNAQLSGIRQYLEPTVNRSKFASWRNANAKVLNKVDEILGGRLYEIQKEVEEDVKLDDKAHSKFNRIKDKKAEKIAMREQTKRNAAKTARQQVEEYEKKRRADEKIEMLKRMPVAEEMRFQWIYATVVFFIAGIVMTAMLLKTALAIALSILSFFLISCAMGYRAYLVGLVLPREVTEEEIERAVMIREEEIFLKAMNTQKRKHQEHKVALAREREYRKQMRAEEAERKAVEDAILSVDLDNFETMIEIEDPIIPEDEEDGSTGLGGESKEVRPESREHKADDMEVPIVAAGKDMEEDDENILSPEEQALRELQRREVYTQGKPTGVEPAPVLQTGLATGERDVEMGLG